MNRPCAAGPLIAGHTSHPRDTLGAPGSAGGSRSGGCRAPRTEATQRLAAAAVPLKHFGEVPGLGRGKKLPRKQKVQSGNRSVYLVNRLWAVPNALTYAYAIGLQHIAW